jgi:tetratricopeptide (TPR) repeat protein
MRRRSPKAARPKTTLSLLLITCGCFLAASVVRAQPAKKPWEKVKGISGKLAKQAIDDAVKSSDDKASVGGVTGKTGADVILPTTTLRSKAALKKERARLKKALKANPDDIGLTRQLGGVLLRLGDLDKALAAFRKVIARQPNDAVAQLELGITEFRRGQLAPATKRFLRATDLAPKLTIAWGKPRHHLPAPRARPPRPRGAAERSQSGGRVGRASLLAGRSQPSQSGTRCG